jgi:ABC-type transport system involved in multi-copper enzyme maturation permease subunit
MFRIGSPILNRELLTFLRTKKAFVGLLLYLLVLAAAAGICWFAANQAGGVRIRADLSRTLFVTFSITQLLIFSAYALIMTSTKINSEQDGKTLELILTAPISNLHVLLAKYASAIIAILLLIVASAPALSLCFLLGGVGWGEVLSVYGIVMLTVVTYGMIGLASSAVFRRNYVALFISIFIGLMLYGGFTLLVLILAETFDVYFLDDEEPIMLLWTTLSPLAAYLFTIGPFAQAVGGWTFPVLGLHVVVQTVILLIALWIAWTRLRRYSSRTRIAVQRRELIRALESEKRSVPEPAPSEDVRRRSRWRLALWRWRKPKPIPDYLNPVLAREDRQFLSRRWWHRLLRLGMIGVGFAILAALLVEVQGHSDYDFDEEMAIIGVGTILLATVFVPLLAARAMTTEREIGALPLLVCTPMRPSQVLFGKLGVILKHVFRAEIIFTFLLLLFLRRLPVGWYPELFMDWVKILLPIFAISTYFVAIGFFYSVLCRKTATSVILTYGTVFGMTIAPLIFLIFAEVVLEELFRRSIVNRIAETVFAFASPILSPSTYFFPDNDLNFWHKNELWGTIFGYCFLMLGISATLVLVSEIVFIRSWYSREGARAAAIQKPAAAEPSAMRPDPKQ